MSDQLRELRALVLDSHSKAFASYNYDQGFQEMRTFVLGHLDALLAAEPEPDPAPSVVTGPQLKAGLGAFLNVFLNGAKPDTIPQMWVTAVNAALEAAERIRTGGQG